MTTEIFDAQYQRLNKKQKEAVDTIEGPVMVIAGPGTGKTQILTLRIANILLKTDTPPSGILALTFTEAGQKAMKLRLRQIIGSRADEVNIYTFHSFAKAVIDEFPEHFPHLARSRSMSDIEAENLLRDILREKKFASLRPFGDPDLFLNAISSTIAQARKEAWSPDDLQACALQTIENLKNDEASLSTRGATKGQLKGTVLDKISQADRTILLAEVYRLYENKKRELRRYDFDDMIFELLAAVKTNPLLLSLLQEKYLYLLVDEHQDTNDAQNLLIKSIAEFFTEPNLFVVGDEKQAIYRFQGASVQNFLRFQHLWPKMKVISLENNYRSYQDLLDAVFTMIEQNYQADEHQDLRVKLKAATDTSAPILVVSSGNQPAANFYLASEIKKIIEADSQATVAVITRTNREVETALGVLEQAGVPAAAERGADIFSHPIGTIFFDLLTYLADPSQTEALAKTAAAGLWGLSLTEAAALIKQLRSNTVTDLETQLPVLADLWQEINHTEPLTFLLECGQKSGLMKLVVTDPLNTEVWRALISLAEELQKINTADDPRMLIQALLAYRQSAEKKSIKIAAGVAAARVQVMTAHSAKGLEFDYVFLPQVTEESWTVKRHGLRFVLPSEGETGDEIRDLRRLFYVALTRAKKQATIIVPLLDAANNPLAPLRFIEELDPARLKHVSQPAMEQPLPTLAPAVKNYDQFTEFTKNILLTDGLSPTALNHFCDCPNKFFFKSILRLPEVPSLNAEKGNAMHQALEAVWYTSDKSAANIANIIETNVVDYFTSSLAAAGDKEIAQEQLIKNIPQVVSELQPLFATTGQIATEKWQEKELTFALPEGGQVDLRLHGKLDVTIETPKEIKIFDYKTKEGMSPAAIRGETKSSDGGYFRQLVFYKLLLADREALKKQQVTPALVFLTPNKSGHCPIVSLDITAADLDNLKNEIQKLITYVWSGQIAAAVCDDKKCEFCALKKLWAQS